tara:strand:- start:227 stop:742 length:516 start_codon:yes stop_codon:yes gene_type:complete
MSKKSKSKVDSSKKKKSSNNNSLKADDLKIELSEAKDKYLRLFAEFENFKKRTAKERLELFKTAGQDIISSLLTVLDDFNRAEKQYKKDDLTSEIEGFILIGNKLKDILKNHDLEEILTKQGDEFDSEKHEAISQLPVNSKSKKGKIIDVVEKGYQLGEKIIRYPKVVVGK